MTPLYSSMLNRKHDILRVILTMFEDKIKQNYQIMKKLTSLHLLCIQSELTLKEGEKILLSLKNLKFNEQESVHLYSPLHLAVLCNKKEIVKILLENPQVDVNIQDNKKNTPLHYAFSFKSDYKKNFELLKLFLDFSIKKVNIMPSKTQTSKPTLYE